ncbi:hypothetical protein KAR91_72970 [Candidatus Pacearchaeota archaeon]|nr:hypothetical protein [Candidatus Pacearchaeota archaeon]
MKSEAATKISQKEIDIIADLLEELAEIMGRRCCNDWTFPKSWTFDEQFKFVEEYHDWNGDPEEFELAVKEGRWLNMQDYAVADFLCAKLRGEVE